MAAALAYVSAALVAGWGVAHVIPTRQVLASFEPVTTANRRILLQEWLAEAFTMWGLAAVVIAATAVPGTAEDIRAWVYRAASALLVSLAVLTALTGARTAVIWFKVCLVLLAASALLLLLASSQ
jgi:hypothetical protein